MNRRGNIMTRRTGQVLPDGPVHIVRELAYGEPKPFLCGRDGNGKYRMGLPPNFTGTVCKKCKKLWEDGAS